MFPFSFGCVDVCPFSFLSWLPRRRFNLMDLSFFDLELIMSSHTGGGPHGAPPGHYSGGGYGGPRPAAPGGSSGGGGYGGSRGGFSRGGFRGGAPRGGFSRGQGGSYGLRGAAPRQPPAPQGDSGPAAADGGEAPRGTEPKTLQARITSKRFAAEQRKTSKAAHQRKIEVMKAWLRLWKTDKASWRPHKRTQTVRPVERP